MGSERVTGRRGRESPEAPGWAPGKGAAAPEGEEGPVGIFPDWRWVYGTVLFYGAFLILALWILTRVLDPGVTP